MQENEHAQQGPFAVFFSVFFFQVAGLSTRSASSLSVPRLPIYTRTQPFHLSLVEVVEEVGEPAVDGDVVLEALREGLVRPQRLRQALPQRVAGPGGFKREEEVN